MATMLFGDAVTEDRVAFGLPPMNVIWLLGLALPDPAVTVFVSAFVVESVVAYTPPEVVFPLAAPKVLEVPLLLRVSARNGTRLLNASRRVTVTAVVELPSATTPLGDSTSADVAVTGAPATKVTLVWGAAEPAVNVIVFPSALLERSVTVSCPFASVVPLVAENVSLPPALLLAKVALWLTTGFEY